MVESQFRSGAKLVAGFDFVAVVGFLQLNYWNTDIDFRSEDNSISWGILKLLLLLILLVCKVAKAVTADKVLGATQNGVDPVQAIKACDLWMGMSVFLILLELVYNLALGYYSGLAFQPMIQLVFLFVVWNFKDELSKVHLEESLTLERLPLLPFADEL